MMGIHQPQKELFSYEVDLDRRVRTDHPLRRSNSVLDLSFVRAEVARCYGFNGHVLRRFRRAREADDAPVPGGHSE